MEIRLISGRINPNYEDIPTLRIEVDGKERIYVGVIESEDCYLHRDLSFVYDIVPMMRMAHAAGTRGEPFRITEVKEEGE